MEAMYASRHFMRSSAVSPLSTQATIGTPIKGKPASSSPPLVAALRSMVKLFSVSPRPSFMKVPGSKTMSFTP